MEINLYVKRFISTKKGKTWLQRDGKANLVLLLIITIIIILFILMHTIVIIIIW